MNKSAPNLNKLIEGLAAAGLDARENPHMIGREVLVNQDGIPVTAVHFGRRGQIKWVNGIHEPAVLQVARSLGISAPKTGGYPGRVPVNLPFLVPADFSATE